MKIKGNIPQFGPQRTRGHVVFHYLKGGRVVAQKWPRKRGPPKSQTTKDQVAAWDAAQEMVKRPEPIAYARALRDTLGTAFYARDIMISAMYGNYVSWPGWGWREVNLATIQQLLDSITTVDGSLILRADAGWQGLAPGSLGQVLTAQGAGADPLWATPSPGLGGLYGAALSAVPTKAGTGLTTWLNQGPATESDGVTGMMISDINNGSGNSRVRGLYKAVPATPFTVTALVSASVNPVSIVMAGIGFYDGVGKLQTWGLEYSGGWYLAIRNWASVTSSGGNLAQTGVGIWAPVWLQAIVTATTVTFGWSYDGINFQTLATVTKSSGYLGSLGYSNLVFWINAQGAATIGSLLSYKD